LARRSLSQRKSATSWLSRPYVRTLQSLAFCNQNDLSGRLAAGRFRVSPDLYGPTQRLNGCLVRWS
jgi:hypothetical protein